MEMTHRNKRKRLLAGLLAFLLAITCIPLYKMEVKAGTDGDYSYWVNEDGESVTITGYHGNGGDITIPSEIDGKPVVSIREYAFYSCNSLNSVTIPESVTSIGKRAFSYCNSLNSMTILGSVTNIGEYIFSYCSSLSSVTIPASVTSIGDGAFFYCSSLSSVTIPASVTNIGEYAFRYCSSLSSVTIPESVTSVANNAFSDCNSLSAIIVETGNTIYDSREDCNAIIETTSNTLISGCMNTTIPASVTSIGDYAFYSCSSLSNVTIPSSVTSIGEYALSDCSSLSSVTIPSSVTSIGWTSFAGCSNLSDIKVEPENTTYDSRENCNAIIKTASNTLIFGCKNTVIPGSVTSIEMNAFAGCSNLSNITIPSSVTSIGECAFSGCSSLTSVVIPEGVTSIGGYSFSGCSSLTSIVIPSSVTSIRNHAFEGSSSVVIRGKKGSYAQKYALSNNIAFEEIEEENPSDSQTPAVTAVDQKISAKNFSKTASSKAQSFKLGATASTALTYASDNKNIKVDANGKVTIAKNFAGKATITINAAATSAYNAATVKITVTVKPAKIAKSKITATAKKKAVKVKFSKAAGAKSYKVEVATDKKFKKNVKSVTVKKTTATIESLKAGKKYYVRITAIGNDNVKASAVVAKKTVKIK